MGDTKGGACDLPEEEALRLLEAPTPPGRPNSDVLVPWVNGMDITRRARGMWVLDYGIGCTESEAAKYEAPFGHVLRNVKPARDLNKRKAYKEYYWRHVEARPAMREALRPLSRFMATPTVAKHRLFVWMQAPTLPDHQLIAFARADDYFFGVLHSRFHETWARAQATQLREAESGTRYTPTSCFDTFPFPWPPGTERLAVATVAAVGEAAARLIELRDRWLNPPEWTRTVEHRFRASLDGPWGAYIENISAEQPVAVYRKMAAIDPKAATALKKRTLTGLYNELPRWLTDAHRQLDEAVAAAYNEAAGCEVLMADSTEPEIVMYLLGLNRERSG
jgi:hypothetical protein